MLAFVHLHKTAGKTINWILRRSFGLRHCDPLPWSKQATVFTAQDYHRLARLYPVIDSISSHALRAYSDLDRICPTIQYFTFMREPLQRSASHYQFTVEYRKKRISFDEWISHKNNRNYQTRVIAGTWDLERAVRILEDKFMFVGLVERFDESLVILTRRYSVKTLNIFYRSKHIAKKNELKNELLANPSTRRQLEESNEIDTLLYEYVFDKLYPKYRAEYGEALENDVASFKRMNATASDINTALLLQFLKRRLVYRPALFAYQLVR
jgi:hypothetical protein